MEWTVWKKCLKEMWSHGGGMPWQANCCGLSWNSITMRPHFFEAFFQTVRCLVYTTTFLIHFYQSILSNSSLPCFYGWKPKTSAFEQAMDAWKKSIKSIIVSNIIDKAVNSLKKCLKEMRSHDLMECHDNQMLLIVMAFHHHETSFLWGIFSKSSLPCLC